MNTTATAPTTTPHLGNLMFRPFTDYDWAIFAGAECLHNGREPMIAPTKEWVFVIGGTTGDARSPHPVTLEIVAADFESANYSQTFDRLDMAIFVASHLTEADMNRERLTNLGFFCHF